MYGAGKGIADQDRNILTNQMLLLGFLRSSVPFLTVGPIPSILGRKRKQKLAEEDEEAEADNDSDVEEVPTRTSSGKRGTILVTLRNVVPYTQW